MKTRFICLICLIGIVLSACGTGNGMAETAYGDPGNEEVSTTIPSEGDTYAVDLSGWEIYKGEVAITGVENLAYLEDCVVDDDVLVVSGKAYTLLDPLMDKLKLSTTSGWRIDLNAMHAKWKTQEGYILLLPGDDTPSVICTYEQESGQIRSYLQQNILNQGIASFALENFDVYYKDCIIQIDERLESIWRYYISDEEFETAVPLFDGDWSCYTLSLIFNNCAGLQYEINFAICDDSLYIENLFNGLICVPISKIGSRGQGDGAPVSRNE